MNLLKKITLILLILAAIVSAMFFYSIHNFVDIGEYKKWEVEPTPNPSKGAVTIQFVGVSTVVISDDSTTLMTDGFFTRPAALDLIFGAVQPDTADIRWSLERLELKKLDAIFVVHSHFDHAMDAPEVARLAGAKMYGSESTANIGRGWNLPENQMEVWKNRQPIQVGKFTITPILSKHYQFANPEMRKRALGGKQEITEPLVPPAPALDYKMGGAYTLLFEHPKGSFVLQSSAGWLENSLEGIQTDIVLLGIGGLGAQTEEYQTTYFKEIVDELQAKQLYLAHWDAFTSSIRKPITGPMLLSDWIEGNTIGAFEVVEKEVAKREGLKANLLPQWEKVVLFE
ncbi:MAG: MBL fold metallo-hydrolase [Chitinophagales bacterium]